MKEKGQKYVACWYCDNIIDHPEQVGLLYLGFPSFDEFLNYAKPNWLDPADKGKPSEQREVLELLWNFSVEQEREEDELYKERE